MFYKEHEQTSRKVFIMQKFWGEIWYIFTLLVITFDRKDHINARFAALKLDFKSFPKVYYMPDFDNRAINDNRSKFDAIFSTVKTTWLHFFGQKRRVGVCYWKMQFLVSDWSRLASNGRRESWVDIIYWNSVSSTFHYLYCYIILIYLYLIKLIMLTSVILGRIIPQVN